MDISKDLPAGNIQVLKIEDKSALLDVEKRDSANEWFYWKMKVVFTEPGLYSFRFERGTRIGTRGPAVSLDHGLSWHWLSDTAYQDTQSFQWNCEEPGEVFFCQAIPYMQREFDSFAKEFASHPLFRLSTLCKSRKGRNVELVTIREGSPEFALLLTARHHCQEMMANQVLEGALRHILADTPEAKEFRKHIAVYAVPFVDKDGSEDGDQGKGRKPFDHGRDYQAQGSIYPECAAIRKLIDEVRPFFILDLHCPWIRGNFNEDAYQVQSENPKSTIEKERFGKLLERESPACAPYFRKHDIPWGVSWNGSWNAMGGVGLKSYGQTLPFVRYCQTIEIPFANFGEHTATRETMLCFGHAIAKAIRLYREELVFRAEHPDTSASLCFTGDILCNPKQTQACSEGKSVPDYTEVFRAVKPLLEQADYTVGNLETVFAGEEAGFSSKLYSFNTPDSFASALADAGFDLVSTANNHCLDRGVAGLKRTLDVLDKAGISHTGTARTAEERAVVCLREINGIRFAFISYSYGTNAFANHEFLKPEDVSAVNLFQEQETLPGSIHLLDSFETIAANMKKSDPASARGLAQLRDDIAAAKKFHADFVIVLMHSGGQYNAVPDPYTEFLVKEICKAGADMIVGNHPHVILKHSVQDGVPVFYSLGNFSFIPGDTPESRQHPESAYSILLNAKFEKKNGKTALAGFTSEVMKCVVGPDGIARTVSAPDGERAAALARFR